MLAPEVASCAGARHVALSTADLFAESLGQRDLEHQNEHRAGYSLFVAERPMAMHIIPSAQQDSVRLVPTQAPRGWQSDCSLRSQWQDEVDEP